MKKLFGMVAAIAIATSLSGQINVGANFLIGLPSGDWHKAGDESLISTAFGGGIEGNYFVTEDLSVGLEVGFLAFGEKDENAISFNVIPITIKGEYYFLDDQFRPFVGLGVGYNLVTGKVTIPALPPLIPEETTTETSFNGLAISPRVGAVYQVSDLIGIVLNINYNLMFGQKADGEGDVIDNSTNWIGIGIGARFTIAD